VAAPSNREAPTSRVSAGGGVVTAIKKSGPHNMQKRFKRLPWLVCVTCGLVGLKNDATREALRKPCTWLEDR